MANLIYFPKQQNIKYNNRVTKGMLYVRYILYIYIRLVFIVPSLIVS